MRAGAGASRCKRSSATFRRAKLMETVNEEVLNIRPLGADAHYGHYAARNTTLSPKNTHLLGLFESLHEHFARFTPLIVCSVITDSYVLL